MKNVLGQWIVGFVLAVAGSISFAMFYGLGWPERLSLMLVSCVLVPVWFRIQSKEKVKWEEYHDMTTYLELFLCSFKKTGHIKMTLEDCQLVFRGDGRMAKAVHKALHILETGETAKEGNVTKSALYEIERDYTCRRMKLLHHFISRAASMGGDVSEALDILLADLEMWKRRFVLYHKKKQHIGRECMLAAILSIVLCGLSHMLIPVEFREMLNSSVPYRVSTVVVFLFLLGAVVIIRYMTGHVQPESFGEKRRDKIVEREFPYWLLSVTLYLQQESLYHALLQSAEETEGIFRREVDCLIEKLYQDPVSLQPYLDFFADLDVPELRTGMKMLYAVNTNGYPDTKRQVHFLVEQNNAVLDRSEREYYRVKLASLGLLRQIPMMLAGGKVMIDMVIFLMIMLERFSVF